MGGRVTNFGYCHAGQLGGLWVCADDDILPESDSSGSPWNRRIAVSPMPTPWSFEWEANLTDAEFEAEIASWDIEWYDKSDLAARSYLFEPPWRDGAGAPPQSWDEGEALLSEAIWRRLDSAYDRAPFAVRTLATLRSVTAVHSGSVRGGVETLADLMMALGRRGWSLGLAEATATVALAPRGAAPRGASLAVAPLSDEEVVAGVRRAVLKTFSRWSGRNARRECARRTEAVMSTRCAADAVRTALVGTTYGLVLLPVGVPCVAAEASVNPWLETIRLLS